jgi:hypothetical protein
VPKAPEITRTSPSGIGERDVLGLNLLLDEVEKEGWLETISVSGFERVRRKKQAA